MPYSEQSLCVFQECGRKSKKESQPFQVRLQESKRKLLYGLKKRVLRAPLLKSLAKDHHPLSLAWPRNLSSIKSRRTWGLRIVKDSSSVLLQ